jgi:hypothetical protein
VSRQPVADPHAGALAASRSELEHEAGAAMRGGPPRIKKCDAKHLAAGRQEDGLDREPHQRRVHRPAAHQQEALVIAEPAAPEQPAQPPARRPRDPAASADGCPAAVADRDLARFRSMHARSSMATNVSRK